MDQAPIYQDVKPTPSPEKSGQEREELTLMNEHFINIGFSEFISIMRLYENGGLILLFRDNESNTYTRYEVNISINRDDPSIVSVKTLDSNGAVLTNSTNQVNPAFALALLSRLIDESDSGRDIFIEHISLQEIDYELPKEESVIPETSNITIGDTEVRPVEQEAYIRYLMANPGTPVSFYFQEDRDGQMVNRKVSLTLNPDSSFTLYEYEFMFGGWNQVTESRSYLLSEYSPEDLIPEIIEGREIYVSVVEISNIDLGVRRNLSTNRNPNQDHISAVEVSMNSLRFSPSYRFLAEFLGNFRDLDIDLSMTEISYTSSSGIIHRVRASEFGNFDSLIESFRADINNNIVSQDFLRYILQDSSQGIISITISVESTDGDSGQVRNNLTLKYNAVSSRIEVVESRLSAETEEGINKNPYFLIYQADGILGTFNRFLLSNDTKSTDFEFLSTDIMNRIVQFLDMGYPALDSRLQYLSPVEFRSNPENNNFITGEPSRLPEQTATPIDPETGLALGQNLSQRDGVNQITPKSSTESAKEVKSGFVLPGARLMYDNRVVIVERKTSDGKMVKVKYENPSPQDPVAFEVSEGDLEWIKRSQPKKSSNLFGRLGEFLRNAAPGR